MSEAGEEFRRLDKALTATQAPAPAPPPPPTPLPERPLPELEPEAGPPLPPGYQWPADMRVDLPAPPPPPPPLPTVGEELGPPLPPGYTWPQDQRIDIPPPPKVPGIDLIDELDMDETRLFDERGQEIFDPEAIDQFWRDRGRVPSTEMVVPPLLPPLARPLDGLLDTGQVLRPIGGEETDPSRLPPPAIDLGVSGAYSAEQLERAIGVTGDIDLALKLRRDLGWALRVGAGIETTPEELAYALKVADGIEPDIETQAQNFQRLLSRFAGKDVPIEQAKALFASNPTIFKTLQIQAIANLRLRNGAYAYPYLRAWLARDPAAAAAVLDDVEGLGRLEAALVGAYGGWFNQHAHALIAGGVNLPVEAARGILDPIARGVHAGERWTTRVFGGDIERVIEAQERSYERLNKAIKGLPYMPRPAQVGYTYDVLRQVPQLASQLLAFQFGGPLAGMGWMGAQIFGGDLEEFFRQGADATSAYGAAAFDAAVQSPLELLGFNALLKPFTRLMGGFKRRILPGLVFDTLKGVATESTTEFLQEFPEALAQLWVDTKRQPEGTQWEYFRDNFDQRIDEARQSGLYSALVMAPLALVIRGGRLGRDYQKALARRVLIDEYEKQGAAARDSGLRTKDPEKFAQFSTPPAEFAKNGTVWLSYEDWQNAYAQSAKEEARDAANLKIEDQLRHARANPDEMPDLAISYPRWLAYMIDTPMEARLRPAIRFSADSYTQAEILKQREAWEAWSKEHDAELKKMRAAGELPPLSEGAQKFRSQLVEVGEMTTAAADHVVRLADAYARVLEREVKEKVDDTWSRWNLELQKERITWDKLASEAVGDRIAAAVLAADKGDMTTFAQVHGFETWITDRSDWMRKHAYSEEQIKSEVEQIRRQLHILSALGPIQIEKFPRGAFLNLKGKTQRYWGTIRTNTDAIYKISFDPSTMCPKRLGIAYTEAYVRKKLRAAGRNTPLTRSERLALVALLRQAGKEHPCLYCYVESPRAAAVELAGKTLEYVFGMRPIKTSLAESTKAQLAAAQAEAAKLQLKLEDIDLEDYLDAGQATSKEGAERRARMPQVAKAIWDALNSAKAKRVELYEEYNGEFLRVVSDQKIAELGGYAGIRFLSSSDFQADHVVDFVQAIWDLAARGARAHAYTKVPEFVEIFGRTGMKIQTSIFARETTDGKVVEDPEGMPWADAKRLRRKYPNVGSVLVATSPKIAAWGLRQPWIDYVLPFHASGMQAKYFESANWTNFTATQSESKLKRDDPKIEKIRMHELRVAGGTGGDTLKSNAQLTRRYLKLALERKIMPVFPQMMWKDLLDEAQETTPDDPKEAKRVEAKRIKIAKDRWRHVVATGRIPWAQIDPNFGKVKKDYARTDTVFEAVRPEFDMDRLEAAIEKVAAGESQKFEADTEIGDKLFHLITQEPSETLAEDLIARAYAGEGEYEQPALRDSDDFEGEGQRYLQEGGKGPRGYIQFGADKKTVIILLQNSDASTVLHEFGHIFLRDLQAHVEQGAASERMIDDLRLLESFADVEKRAWAKDDVEKVTRAFERYLREGVAPSVELRGAFSRFRQWLVGIYRSIEGYAEISDEVRGVFDRMLATEEELARAAEERHGRVTSFISTLDADRDELAKLTEAEAAAIEETRARQIAYVLEAYFKANGGRKALAAKARTEIEAQPIYQAIDALAKEGGLDLDELRQVIGEERTEKLRDRHEGIVRKGGNISLDTLTAMLEKTSHEDSIGALEAAQRKGDAIKAHYRVLLAEKEAEFRRAMYGEAEMGVDEAGANDAAIELAALEHAALEKRRAQKEVTRAKRIATQAAKDHAWNQVASMRLGEAIQYNRWLYAAQRSSTRALAASRKKNWEEAAQAKKAEVENLAMARASIKIRELYFEAEAKLKKLGRAQNIEETWHNYIRDILYRWGLAGSGPKLTKSLEQFLAEEEADSPYVFASMVMPQMLAPGEHKLSDLTFAELEDFVDGMTWLATTGSDLMKAIKMAEAKSTAEAAAVLSRPMSTLKPRKKLYEDAFFYRAKRILRAILEEGMQMQHRMAEVDGYTNFGVHRVIGPNEKHLFGALQEATTREWKEWERLEPEMREIGEALLHMTRRLDKKFGSRSGYYTEEQVGVPLARIPELVEDLHQVGTRRWTAERMISIMFNLGNPGNESAVREGYGYTDDDIAAIKRHFSPEEIDVFQRVWDLINRYYEPMARVHKLLHGVTPPKVEAHPMTVAYDDGTTHTVAGGYYPAIFDHHLNERHGERVEADLMKNSEQAIYHRAGVKRGFTYKRTGGKLPPLLTTGVLFQHLRDVIHYIEFAAAIRDVDKITRDPAWRRTFEAAFGKEAYREIRPWLSRIARPILTSMLKGEQVLDRFRATYSVLALWGNVNSMLLQPTSLLAAVSEVGTIDMFKGLGSAWKKFGANPAAVVRQVNELSQYMRQRQGSFDREVADAIAAHAKAHGWARIRLENRDLTLKDVQDAGMTLYGWADAVGVYPAWLAAYTAAQGRLLRGDASLKTEADCIAYADNLIRQVMPGAQSIDLSSIQGSRGWLRLFSSFLTAQFRYGSRAQAYYRGWRQGRIPFWRYLRHTIFESVLPPMAWLTGAMWLATGEPPKWWQYALAVIAWPISWVPILGQIVSGMTSRPKMAVPVTAPFERFGAAFMGAIRGAAATAEGAPSARRYWMQALVGAGELADFAIGLPAFKKADIFLEGLEELRAGKSHNPFRLFIKKQREQKL